MRRTHLDELPQFWNVLLGDMSLVGTRPPTRNEVERYENHHHRRLSMRPGITGIWQVTGNDVVHDFEEVVKLDCRYIDEWSLGLDLRLLGKTLLKSYAPRRLVAAASSANETSSSHHSSCPLSGARFFAG